MKITVDRPIVEITPSRTDVVVEVIAGVVLAAIWIYLAAIYPSLPNKVPTHFGFAGVPDAWGTKSEMWVMPVIATIAYLALAIVGRFPQVYNYPVQITPEHAVRQYTNAVSAMRWLKMEVVVLCCFTTWQTARVAQGSAQGLGAWFLPVLVAGFTFTTIWLVVQSVRLR